MFIYEERENMTQSKHKIFNNFCEIAQNKKFVKFIITYAQSWPSGSYNLYSILENY